MGKQKKVARFVMDVSGRFSGRAELYRLSHVLRDEDRKSSGRYVVVSAVSVAFTGPETYIFPADETGAVRDWGELPGSYRGGLSIQEALERAGYVVVN
jgi:hypothetical protein